MTEQEVREVLAGYRRGNRWVNALNNGKDRQWVEWSHGVLSEAYAQIRPKSVYNRCSTCIMRALNYLLKTYGA